MQARFRKQDISIMGESSKYTRVADSGTRLFFRFCPTCGSTVYFESEKLLDTVIVPIGVFADSEFPAPQVAIHEPTRHPWVRIDSLVE